jgi:hypothetical protein
MLPSSALPLLHGNSNSPSNNILRVSLSWADLFVSELEHFAASPNFYFQIPLIFAIFAGFVLWRKVPLCCKIYFIT